MDWETIVRYSSRTGIWCLRRTGIKNYIEVPIDDLNPLPQSARNHSPKRAMATTSFLWPTSNHPHTSKVDAESDMASSMRVSVLSQSLPMRKFKEYQVRWKPMWYRWARKKGEGNWRAYLTFLTVTTDQYWSIALDSITWRQSSAALVKNVVNFLPVDDSFQVG